MGDSLSIVFTVIVAVLIMFLFPMLDSWERQDDLSYMAVYSATTDFVDAVRNTGALTSSMYNSFLTQIYGTGNSFEVTLEHREYLVVPTGDINKPTEVDYLYHYTSEIESALNSGDVYAFDKGDFFYVSVKNTNKTQATMMKQTIYGTLMESFSIGVPYGGQIKSSY
ncbi:MAG: hypothetical protein IKJ32_03840 [Clostridia bacterium]|nr:hypothetical protein [Clostridia bacterium]